MKYRYSFLIFLAAFIFQGTFLNAIEAFGVTPDLILCFVVMFSFLYSKEMHAVIFGTVFGFLADICFIQYPGVSALGYFITAIAVIAASRVLNRENIGTAIVLVTSATVLFGFYLFFFNMFMGGADDIRMLLLRMPLMVVLNVITSMIIYQFFIRRVVRFRNDRYYRS